MLHLTKNMFSEVCKNVRKLNNSAFWSDYLLNPQSGLESSVT